MAKQYGELHRWGGFHDQWALQTSERPGSTGPLSDANGKVRVWSSEIEALNALAAEGWELASTASQSKADHPDQIYVRFFLALNT